MIRKDVALAILKMDATPSKKISARMALAEYSMEEISSIEFTEWSSEIPLVTVETLRGKPLSVEFVEEVSFFYGMEINNLEQFELDSRLYEYENFGQLCIDWAKVEVEEEPCPYDMVLINGKYWTPAPNLPLIREMAIF